MLDKLARCIKQERLRLVLKGNGYIVALVFNVVALSIYRHFCETHWEGIRKSTDNPKFHLFFCATQLIIWAVHGLNFLFYGIIDHFNIFYKYKVNKVRQMQFRQTCCGMSTQTTGRHSEIKAFTTIFW